MPKSETFQSLVKTLWAEVGGNTASLSALSITGSKEVLPSVYPVTEFAAATVGLATLAVAEWATVRSGAPLATVSVDRAHAAIAFRSERYLERPMHAWPSLWDPIAGDYVTRDGFIRLHTNYAHHRAAADRVLGSENTRDQVEKAVARMDSLELEAAIVSEGGCAAMMRTQTEWSQHPQGEAVGNVPTIDRDVVPFAGTRPGPSSSEAADPSRPLTGIRVLDLTRVIAGPVCTRFLAAWGADVLRVDPVGFLEADLLMADTTVGKRCTTLDLRDKEGRQQFDSLLARADVVVHGYRSDALSRLGYDSSALRRNNPSLVIGTLDAYGFVGPWSTRRGFDSLVQMSCGIAARGQNIFGTELPKPLPAQALDHGSGYLLAAAVCRSLCDARTQADSIDVRVSLAGTAKALMSMGESGDPLAPEPAAQLIESFQLAESGPFGQIRRVACPGRIGKWSPRWDRSAVWIGSDDAIWHLDTGSASRVGR
jgi:hypothetical protein